MKALCQEEEDHGPRMAPLIDCVFLLLTFFLVATTFYEAEKDISIRLATATEGDAREKKIGLVVINIRESGVMVVNERVMTLDALREHLTAVHGGNPDVVVVVRCDRRASHAYFVDALNLCKQVRIGNVSVATLQTDD